MSRNRYLIFGGPGIGDTIIELIFAKALKASDPSCEVDLVFSSSLGSAKVISELLNYQSIIRKYYFYNRNSKLTSIKTIFKLFKNHYTYSFSCTTAFKANNKAAIISRIIHTTSVIKKVANVTRKVSIPVIVDENIHIVNQYGKLLESIGFNSQMNGEVLDPFKIDRYHIAVEKPKKIITICLGANTTIYHKDGKSIHKQIKEWGMKRWNQLAILLSQNGFSVILIGGKKEKEDYCKIIENKTNKKNILFLAGETTIGESLSILSQSRLVIGADTGLMHCAAALGKPTLTLFGGTDSNIWKPFSEISYTLSGNTECAPCYGKQYAVLCENRRCMKSISVNSVLEEIKRIVDDTLT